MILATYHISDAGCRVRALSHILAAIGGQSSEFYWPGMFVIYCIDAKQDIMYVEYVAPYILKTSQ